MKQQLFTGLLLLTFLVGKAQHDSVATNLLFSQLHAFNAQNVEALANNLHPDFAWYWIYSDTVVLEVQGVDSFKVGMELYYKYNSGVRSEIANYSVSGDRISFTEVAHWQEDSVAKQASSLGSYDIKDGKIWRVWYVVDGDFPVQPVEKSEEEQRKEERNATLSKMGPILIVVGSLALVGDALLVDDNEGNGRGEGRYKPTPFGILGMTMIGSGILIWPGAVQHVIRNIGD
jgi:hypothetical protein